MLKREFLGPRGMHASVYFLVEVNRCAERRTLRRMLRGWDVVRSAGNNDAYSDPAVHRIVSSAEFPLASTSRQGRRVTVVTYEHLSSGIRWTAAVTHLSSSARSTPEDAHASRAHEAASLIAVCQTHGVDIIAADLNNSSVGHDRPRGIIEGAGYRDWRSLVDVDNVHYDTHHTLGLPLTTDGKHLDALYFGSRITALKGRILIDEPNNSDHLGLVCALSVAM